MEKTIIINASLLQVATARKYTEVKELVHSVAGSFAFQTRSDDNKKDRFSVENRSVIFYIIRYI